MPAYIPANFPEQDTLLDVGLIPIQVQSLADGSNNLIGSGAANSGVASSGVQPCRATDVVIVRTVPLTVCATGGPMVVSSPTTPPVARLLLSYDGVTFIQADQKVSRLGSITDHVFRFVDYVDRVYNTATWFDASGNMLPNPTSQPLTFRAPWFWFCLLVTPVPGGDAMTVMAGNANASL